MTHDELVLAAQAGEPVADWIEDALVLEQEFKIALAVRKREVTWH